jgi:coproporphyrinogen III oxidase
LEEAMTVEHAKADRQDAAVAWFAALRDRLCAAFEAIEAESGGGGETGGGEAGRFERTAWRREGGGGGVMAVMRGRVFEKVGVNVSTVWGGLAPEFARSIPGAGDDPRFWAAGVSLVAHMVNPQVPAAHLNTRMIVTTQGWFGGGADLTPAIAHAEDTADFHAALKAPCDRYGEGAYARFKAWCDDYFFLPHRGEARGVGGIFYDNVDTGDWERDFRFTREVGEAFLDVFPRLVRRRMASPWTAADRRTLALKRARYAEFNLLYDRGTLFGLKTGGNPEAILMSLPPTAAWP